MLFRSLSGYYPPPDASVNRTLDAAVGRLGALLADAEVWSALSLLSLRLHGTPLSENGRPVGELLDLLAAERRWQRDLAGALLGALDVARPMHSE